MNTYRLCIVETKEELTLHTTYEFPPIPIRWMDWSCIDDNYDGAPDANYQVYGQGRTELEAIQDYLNQL